jgi:hypothetical protein
MKTQINKKIYIEPQIELVKLDNDISLALDSAPPEGPGENLSKAPEYFSNDPFKSENC